MQTALIRVDVAAAGGYEARFGLPWGQDDVLGEDAPRVHFDQLPQPPDGYPDVSAFMLDTAGTSPHFLTLGRALGDLLLAGDIAAELVRARADDNLRLLLDIVPDDLKKVPWELMRGPGGRLFTDTSNPVSRVSASFTHAAGSTEVSWPLRVMVVVGTDDTSIGVSEEVRHIREAFRAVCGLVDLQVLRCPTRQQIRDECEAMRPHVFHFIGHGDRADDLGGYLVLHRTSGGAVPWTGSDIRDDLAAAPPRLAILNACHSGGAGERDGTWAAAQGLTELRVPAVVAMQGPIRADAAERFAKGFFKALATGQAMDVAMSRGRLEITDVAHDNRRDLALPCLILSAPPENILDLSEDPSTRLGNAPFNEAMWFVDRLPNRRRLWDRLRAQTASGTRIFTVSGPPQAGKGSLVRWCLGVALLRGHAVAHVDFSDDDEGVDSVMFLEELVQKLPVELIDPVHGEVDVFTAHLSQYRTAQRQARAERLAYLATPEALYEEFRLLLATVAADRDVTIGIDGVTRIENGEWGAYAVPGLIRPIADGQVGQVRLIASLNEDEVSNRFSRQYFKAGEVEDFPLRLFPAEDFVDLVSQWLRAQNYVWASFEQEVIRLKDLLRGEWSTLHFDMLKSQARAMQWEMEP
jgi:hypothetical protein